MQVAQISGCYINYMAAIGCRPPRQTKGVHHCAECNHKLNMYQAAVSKYCGACTRVFKEFYDRDGLSYAKEGYVNKSNAAKLRRAVIEKNKKEKP